MNTIALVVVLIAFVGFILWRMSENKKNTSGGPDNYVAPDNRDVDKNPADVDSLN